MGPGRAHAAVTFLNISSAPPAVREAATPRYGNVPKRSSLGGFLWRVGFLSIVTCVVAIRTGSDELVGQLFGLLGASCCAIAYKQTWSTPRLMRDRAPSDALERTIRMGVINSIDPQQRRRSA